MATDDGVAAPDFGGAEDLVTGLQFVQPGFVGLAEGHGRGRHADVVELSVLDHPSPAAVKGKGRAVRRMALSAGKWVTEPWGPGSGGGRPTAEWRVLIRRLSPSPDVGKSAASRHPEAGGFCLPRGRVANVLDGDVDWMGTRGHFSGIDLQHHRRAAHGGRGNSDPLCLGQTETG